jgi:hypothetical protein
MSDSKSLDSLRNEMFMILQLCWVELRLGFKIALNSDSMSGPDFLAIFYSLQVINNEITVRLNKFVDKRKDVCSLYSVIKELKQTKRAKLSPDLAFIEKEIENFVSTEFVALKNRRDEKLAHLKKGNNNTWQEGSHVLGPVLDIRDFLDKLNGSKIEYIWKDERLNKDLDLRSII